MDPRMSNIGGPDPCDPCGVDAYGCIVKAEIHYTSFLVASRLQLTSWRLPRNKSAT